MAVTEYIGARYVPKFSDINGGDWDNTYSYEPLEIVKNGNDYYTSKKPVPIGAAISDTTYWALTGNYNGAIASLTARVAAVEAAVAGVVPNFDCVASMVAADLAVNDIVKTASYYNNIEGGSGLYLITNSGLTPDGGSVIALANGYRAELILDNKIVTPEQFGARGDALSGTPTDSSTAIQNALNFCFDNDLDLYCNHSYYINSTITVPRGVSLISFEKSERIVTFWVGTAVTVAFKCGYNNVFDGISIHGVNNTFRDFDVLEFDGIGGNVDSVVKNCDFFYCGKCIIVHGRNIDIYDNMFVHCRYGVYFDFDSSLTNMRGLNIHRNRFHGVGEETAMDFLNSAGIYIDFIGDIDLVIEDNESDMSGCFFNGNCYRAMICGNYIRSFVSVPIYIHRASNSAVISSGIDIMNNTIIGINGQDGLGINRPDYPDYGIQLLNINRVNICNNSIQRFKKAGINMDTCNYGNINGNWFYNCVDNNASNAVLLLDDNRVLSIMNNSGVNDATKAKLAQSSDGIKYSTAYLYNNWHFDAATDVTILS